MVSALLASKPKVESFENPGVLAAGSGGGNGIDSPQLAQLGKQRFNLGASLQQYEQLKFLAMLEINADRFAFALEDIEPFTGEPMQIQLNSSQPIFRPPHKLG